MDIVGTNVKGEIQEGKIRNVLSDPYKEEICLDDVIQAFVGSGKSLAALEYKNNPGTLREAKKQFKKAKMVMLEFEKRLKEGIGAEIVALNSKD